HSVCHSLRSPAMPGPNGILSTSRLGTTLGANIGTTIGTTLVASTRLGTLASGDRASIQRELANRPLAVQDFSTTFADVCKSGVANAAAFSVAFATTLQTNDQAGQFFEDVALASPEDRAAILDAHKAAGIGESVVHGVSLLPAAHGRLVMQDFLYRSGQLDTEALGQVMDWVSLAGR